MPAALVRSEVPDLKLGQVHSRFYYDQCWWGLLWADFWQRDVSHFLSSEMIGQYGAETENVYTNIHVWWFEE